MHAAWNFVSKRETPSAAFFLAASAGVSAIALLIGILYFPLFAAIPLGVWGLLVVTGIFQAGYFVALAEAYRAGAMSVAYPIARSAPVLIVIVQATLLNRADEISLWCAIGIGFTFAGCMMLPLSQFREWRPANYFNKTCAFAVLAAIGTTGYTIIDDEALRQLRGNSEFDAGPYLAATVYITAEYVTTTIWLAAYVFLVKHERARLRAIFRKPLRTLATGVAIYVTYGLVLVALAFVDNVSYAAAFRQASIPLAALLGIGLLREPTHAPKLAGVGLVTIGLVLVAMG